MILSQNTLLRGPFICGFEWKEKCQGSGRRKKNKIKNEKNEKQQKTGEKKHKKKTKRKNITLKSAGVLYFGGGGFINNSGKLAYFIVRGCINTTRTLRQ